MTPSQSLDDRSQIHPSRWFVTGKAPARVASLDSLLRRSANLAASLAARHLTVHVQQCLAPNPPRHPLRSHLRQPLVAVKSP
jgi:hypothetical protein